MALFKQVIRFLIDGEEQEETGKSGERFEEAIIDENGIGRPCEEQIIWGIF